MTGLGRINTFRNAVKEKIGQAIPDLRSCENQFGRFNLEELETQMLRAPAVRMAVLSAPFTPEPSAERSADLMCAAFIVTEGRDRDEQGWDIAEAIAVLCHPSQMWGLVRLGVPRNVMIQPVISAAIKQHGVCIIAVEWRQQLHRLGDGIFTDESLRTVKSELIINGEDVT